MPRIFRETQMSQFLMRMGRDRAHGGGVLCGDGKVGKNIPDTEHHRGQVLEAGTEQGV